jgi:hypothetical protein
MTPSANGGSKQMARPDNGGQSPGGWRPVPDPTVLTTEQLLREISGLRELLQARFEQLLSELVQHQELTQSRFKGLDEVNRERVLRVKQQFQLVEQQRVEQKSDTKAAVDAALTAQKEAVKEQTTAFALATAKSESSFTKQLEQLAATFQTATTGQDRAINDLKERIALAETAAVSRVALSENRLTTLEQQKVGAKDNTAMIAAFIGFIVVLLSIIGFIAARLH